jgi:hypothetical protein
MTRVVILRSLETLVLHSNIPVLGWCLAATTNNTPNRRIE